ncbi:ferripyochelin binding protein [Thermoplasma volcanium GSS1]|uniref:Ferripyochelin binding protein n=1 Tax=Thermoplasma volcanium (strain ATCC 51530 / DSM 4299 / JCM 9571 / NBRC 15438 / GSS1) TaxID=273116 RepID=Q97B52_THEVO|nr:gamma carbonic anhydrase family protein [Thermoplasma volcanium]BAB59748.1 ferripyochelin binding protein [Thermoplasma volcanium GSS1]
MRIGKNVYIAETAVVIGDVDIADGVSIFDSAVLRADLEKIIIGENTNIQDNVTIHTDVGYPTRIGKYVSIGHNAVVHGCTVEDEVLIGMGAIIMNGAQIGHGSIVGAGAVVTKGFKAPEYSVILGLPAKVMRLNQDQISYVKANAEDYIKLRDLYLSGKFERYRKNSDH